jgi:hypothetical protein
VRRAGPRFAYTLATVSHQLQKQEGTSRMRRRTVLVLVSSLAAAVAPSFGQDAFTAELGWVPIGGAERNEVAGTGSASATLNGSRLSITGSFAGLPAKVTGAKLHRGIATGARGAGPVVAELRVTGDVSGTLTGDVRLSGEQVAALNAGQLYVQVYSEKGVPPDHATLFGWLLR